MNKINKKELHQIFENLKNKEKGAYNKLYENYYSLIYGIVFSILKNKEDSEDITHEIFTKIYRLDASKLPTSSEASWLFTVSKNECFLFLRKSKPNINIDEIYEIPASSNEIDNVIDVEYFNKLISGLKEEDKMIVSLKALSNFTFKKISQIMNIPIGTVQWKYYNAINALKVSLGSLAGAVIAFIFVVANGKLWKKEDVFNKSDIEDENTKTSEFNSNESDTNRSSEINIESSDLDSKKDIKESGSNTVSEAPASVGYDVPESANGLSLSGTQPIFLTIGIVFLAIFLIFFKIYQQKLRKKTSK